MRVVKFLLAVLLTAGLTYLLSTPQRVGESKIPPLGNLLNPFTGFWQNAESTQKPTAPPPIVLKALSSDAQVVYDDRLVPHIFAKNYKDAMFLQGYITAQHRLWQMEFQTHAAAGRISEIVGNKALEYDKSMRRMGLAWGAKRSLEAWKKHKSFDLIEAYCDGVNAYINSLSEKDLPLEYKILNYKPEPWTPYKCALMNKSMANTLARQDDDFQQTNMLKTLGRELFDVLYPEQFPEQSPIIPEGTKWDFQPVPLPASAAPMPRKKPAFKPLPPSDPGIGSNNWAVAGSKTASGSPILCGDPHLRLTLPSIWYEIQIATDESNVYGVSLPGIPGVVIGFNGDIAWSMTNVGRDVLDWYAITWKDDSKQEYRYDSTYRKVEIEIEEIKIRDSLSVFDTIRYTHYGPVVFESKDHPKRDLALRWLLHDAPTGDEMSVFRGLAKAKTYEHYVAAIKNFDCPAQNFVFASKTGDVALWCQGRYPLKSYEQGRFVMDGSKSANEWHGFVPQTHNPHVLNPPRGFVSSANQHSTDKTYPYYYRGNFADYRGRRINYRLAAMDSITVEDLMGLQNDNFVLLAAENLPLFFQYIQTQNFGKQENEILTQLKNWKFRYEKDLIEPTVFAAWYDEFYDLLWDEVLRFEDSMDIVRPENWRTTALLRDNPTSLFFDNKGTPEVETVKEIVTQAFQQALSNLKENSESGEIPTWRNYKNTTISHLAGKALRVFSAENVDVGGNRYAPNAVSEENGPSWRMVVELGKTPKAYGVYPGGQSGNPGSPFFMNFIDYWTAGKYYELLFLPAATTENDRILFVQHFKK